MTIEDAYQALMLRRTLDASAISSVTAHSAGRHELDSADQSWRDSVAAPAAAGPVPDTSSPLLSASAFSRSSRPVAGRLVLDDTSAWSDALPTPTSVATTPATAAGAAAGGNTTAATVATTATAAAAPSSPASSCYSLSSLPGGVHAALDRASGDAAAMARSLDELAVQTAAATQALRPAAAAAAAPSEARSPSAFSAASSSLPETPSCCSDVSVGGGRQRRQPRRAPPRAVVAAAAAAASAARDGHADVARMARHAERIALDEASHALYQAELVSSLYEKRTVRDRVFRLWREQVAVAAYRRRVALARALREWRRATAARCHRRYAALQARRRVDPLWAEGAPAGASPARPQRERAMVRGEAATAWRDDPVCVRYRSAAGVVATALQRDGLASTEHDRTPRGMSVASPLTASPAAPAVAAEVVPVETASAGGGGGISDSVLSASVLDSTGSPAPRRRSPFPMPCLDTSPRATTLAHTAVASSYRYVPSDSSTEGAEVTKVQEEADWEVPDITEGMQKAYSMAACSAFVDVMEAKVLHTALLRWKARTAHARRRQTILQV